MTDDEKSRPNDGEETVFDGSVAPMALGASATLAAEGKKGRSDDESKRSWMPSIRPGITAAVVLVAILALAIVPAVSSSVKKTPKDKVGISYGGGPFEGEHYQRVVQPGSSLFFNGWFDKLYLYPADQQNYIVSGTPAAKSGSSSGGNGSTTTTTAAATATAGSNSTVSGQPVVAPSKNRVQVTYQVAVYYRLNIDKLRSFHENFGLKYQAYWASGWKNLVQDTLRQQIENALLEETRRYDVDDIYGNVDVLLKIQTEVQNTLSERLRLAMGDDYFCAPTYEPGRACGTPTFVVKSVDIPPSIVSAYEANRSSSINIQTRENELEQRRIEAEGVRVLNEALGDNGDVYALLRAIESGKINFWVIPDASGLDLNTGGDGTSAPATPGADAGG